LVLRAIDYGDADRIVTLLTAQFGKAAYVARSARRSKKRFGGALEPFSLLSVELTRGKAQLGGLSQAQVTRSFPRILSDLGRMSAGFTGLLLLRELLPEYQPDATVFATALEFLAGLDAPEVAAERLLLGFEVRLLSLAGFAPDFDHCGFCGKQPRADQAGLFDPQQGHLVCRACGGATHRVGGRVRVALTLATGPGWLGAVGPEWSANEHAEARAAVLDFIEHRLGRPLAVTSLL
jgi:DNA repair protein RecO (recombination protein O)